ncbi:MAG: putative ABC transporter permease [Spirochaetales bacterium]|nr:putative ABC transporter permease [Spirochaetales bacterium]
MMEKISNILQILFRYQILFSFGTILGWIIELLWRRAFEDKRWFNPGFLQGPWLPVYGVGTIFLYILCSFSIPVYIRAILFLVSLTVLEYVAGLIFLKYFKIKLWDYSKHWANLQGLICPLYSLLWTILGFIFYFLIFPFLNNMVNTFYDYPYLIFFFGIYAGLFGIDLWKSFDIAGKIRHYIVATEGKGHIDFEMLKLELSKRVRVGFRNKPLFFLPFRGAGGEGFRETLSKHTANISKRIKTMNKTKNNLEKK